MLRPTRFLITLALLTTAATGCAILGDNGTSLGILNEDYYEPLVAPDTVQVNTDFDVTITTFGSNSCWSPAREEVERAPMRVDITVYDQYETGDVACLDAIRPLSRTISMAFANTGEAIIELNGRRPGPVDNPEPLTLTHTVVVE